jgi:hypothetical protein
MPAITTVRRIESGTDAFEIIIDWGLDVRRYTAKVSDEGGLRVLHSEELEADLPRCPTLLKHVGPLVFQLHDGRPPALPVIFGALSMNSVR